MALLKQLQKVQKRASFSRPEEIKDKEKVETAKESHPLVGWFFCFDTTV